MAVETVPDGFPTIPILATVQGSQVYAFLQRAFEAKLLDRHYTPGNELAYMTVRIGDSVISVMRPLEGRQPTRSAFYIYVADVDLFTTRAVDAGAQSVQEPLDVVHGDRMATVIDPFGNQWTIATRIEQVLSKNHTGVSQQPKYRQPPSGSPIRRETRKPWKWAATSEMNLPPVGSSCICARSCTAFSAFSCSRCQHPRNSTPPNYGRKFGAPLSREIFRVPPGFDLVVDYGASSQVCRLQNPALMPADAAKVQNTDDMKRKMQAFLADLVPDSMRGKSLRRMFSQSGAFSGVSSDEYEHVTVVETHSGTNDTISVTFQDARCQHAEQTAR